MFYYSVFILLVISIVILIKRLIFIQYFDDKLEFDSKKLIEIITLIVLVIIMMYIILVPIAHYNELKKDFHQTHFSSISSIEVQNEKNEQNYDPSEV